MKAVLKRYKARPEITALRLSSSVSSFKKSCNSTNLRFDEKPA